MPGMYAFRSSSSASKPPIPSRQQRHAPTSAASRTLNAPPPPSASRPIPAFHKSANPALMPVIPVAPMQPILARQGMDPSEEAACIRQQGTPALNYSSSGSPHDPSTVCLSAMVHEFLEEELGVGSCGRTRCNCDDGVCSDNDNCVPDEGDDKRMADEQLCEILEGITSCTSKQEMLLLVDVARLMEAEMEELIAGVGSAALVNHLRRPVMNCLRQEGYNAAICKSRWNHGDGLPAGDYEYIDVLVDGNRGSKKQERFIVDLDFKAQFEIARASRQYTQLLNVLPRLYVGRAERLKQILKIMSNAAKHSLKDQGLLLPPWRKHKYLEAKWFSSYRRTTNIESVQSPQSPHHVLELGIRPKILSLDFTREMDLLFYKAQVRGMNHMKRGAKAAIDSSGAATKAGFLNSPREVFTAHRDVCTAVCTDWQLPTLDEKCKSSRDRVSGISTAFKQASLLPKQAGPRLVSVGS